MRPREEGRWCGPICAPKPSGWGALVRTLMAPQPPAEATALVALMLLHDARRDARLDAAGDLVVLEQQDRGRWDRRQIAEALPLVDEALGGGPGPFALQAAISAVHCRAARAEDTDWPQIVRLYDLLERLQPSPIVSLNRAVAEPGAHVHQDAPRFYCRNCHSQVRSQPSAGGPEHWRLA